MTTSSRVPVAVAAATTLAAVVLAGCGIGSTDAVEELEPEELAALDQTTTSSTSTTIEMTIATEPNETTADAAESVPPASDVVASSDVPTTTAAATSTSTTIVTESVVLYFVDGSQLVAVDTPVPAPARLRAQLDALGTGPPEDAFETGIRTAVPPDLVHGLRLVPGGVTVDLNSEPFSQVDSQDQRTVVAQIVLTLTARPGIEEVHFTMDGEPMRVYQREGVLSEPGEPVTREDYEELLAEGERPDPS